MLLSAFRPSRSRSDDGATNETALRRQRKSSNLSLSTSFLSRTKPAAEVIEVEEQHELSLQDLNDSLFALAELFPDVRPDVFREMLSSLSEESRRHIVADRLLNSGALWIRGRWRISSRIADSKILSEALEIESQDIKDTEGLVPIREQFRSKIYKAAVKTALEDEFRTLSRTAIEGVLAEQNFSYTLCRPVLAELAAKSWRISFKALMKWKKTSETHFMLVPVKTSSTAGMNQFQLKKTGSAELDEELYQTVLKPILDKDGHSKEAISQELAILLNNAEAKENHAVYECECCYEEVAFESIGTCSTGEHILCFSCIRNTVSAALYAQAWSKTIDHERSALLCFSPGSDSCEGCLPNHLTKRALLQARGGSKTWLKFEEKLAVSARQATGISYHECPFCVYAEDENVYWPKDSLSFSAKGIQRLSDIGSILIMSILSILFCSQYFWLSFLLPVPTLQSLFQESLDALARRRQLGIKFHCLNPDCKRDSCRLCKIAWRDPHKCNEKEEVSLRTSIEAAKSAATKRVCPKCNLSFVKDSGCNKMTCTCGYTMCYLCRQGLGQTTNKDNPHDDHDYSHFCGHFRAFPGRCVQCDKCDLYREGNQEETIRKAGETAEREWHAAKQKNSQRLQSGANNKSTRSKAQAFADRIVDTFITC